MTPRRYIAVIQSAPGAEIGAREGFANLVRGIDGLELAYEDDLAIVAATRGSAIPLDEQGIVLGSLIARDASQAIEELAPEQARSIRATGGDELIARYWGPYVAILSDPDRSRVDVVRSPLGELPCYYLDVDRATVVASDVDLLVACRLFTPRIAWDEIVRHLVTRDIRGSATCLAGLRELPGGQRLSIAADERRAEERWSPWTFTGRDRALGELGEAAQRLRTIMRACVAARASEHRWVVLMLSGGLDSSIVAACLASQDLPFHGLTLVTRDATGDERHHARRVSEFLGRPLTEARRDVSRIDVGFSAARRLPRPTVRAFVQESRRLAAETPRDAGATAIFNGGGGDNVFCALQSAAPAADRLLTAGPGRAFLRTARDISELAPASLWAVMRDAIRRAWFGKPAFRQVSDRSLLARHAWASVDAREVHPWLVLPPDALPGKAMHVRLLAFAQSFVEGQDPQDLLPSVSPLLAQPLVEACLAVPSWLWFDGGQNRVVARRAFAADLPLETIRRRSKGTPDSFVAEIFETHRMAIRGLLADGELAARSLLDMDAVLGVLDDPRPVHGDAFRRVLEFADVEAWVRAWTASGR